MRILICILTGTCTFTDVGYRDAYSRAKIFLKKQSMWEMHTVLTPQSFVLQKIAKIWKVWKENAVSCLLYQLWSNSGLYNIWVEVTLSLNGPTRKNWLKYIAPGIALLNWLWHLPCVHLKGAPTNRDLNLGTFDNEFLLSVM